MNNSINTLQSNERSFCKELEEPVEIVSRDQDSEKLIQRVHNEIIGRNETFQSPYGTRELLYADYTASGKNLTFIEDYIQNSVLPLYGNTHTTTSITGLQSTCFRHEARQIIAEAANAKITGRGAEDCVLFTGSGSSSAIYKLMVVLGLHVPWVNESPVVFVGPFEHHSNLLPWRESAADVVQVRQVDGKMDVNHLEALLKIYKDRPLKVGSFSAASNVTGVLTDVDEVTCLLHQHGALACWDYAACAPYVEMNMNPVLNDDRRAFAYKDAIFFSGHKFIGGPGSPGVLIAKKRLLAKPVPTHPGGGTVFYVTDEDHRYLSNKVEREEGGTPDIIGSIRLGLAVQLKQQIGAVKIQNLEDERNSFVMERLGKIENVVVLGSEKAHALPIFSFLIQYQSRYLHYNLVCALLNDLFGIQSRGGCQCAGPYSQALLGVTKEDSLLLEKALLEERELFRPGYSRLSLPYFMSNHEVKYVIKCIEFVAQHGWKFLSVYKFNHKTGEWKHPARFTKFPNRIWLSNVDFTTDQSVLRDTKIVNRDEYLAFAEKLVQDANIFTSFKPSSAAMFDEAQTKLRWFALHGDVEDLTCPNVFQPTRYVQQSIPNDANVDSLPSSVAELKTVLTTAVETPVRDDSRDHGGKYPLQSGNALDLESSVKHAAQATQLMSQKLERAKLFPTPPKKLMKKVGQATMQWDMIQPGDRLLLGLSGGKDSLSMLHVLLALQKRSPIKFELACATVDPQTESFDPSPLKDYLKLLGVPYFYLSENIVEQAKCSLIGDSLCSFCSRMKRGMLYTCCRNNRYNKLVLAQHLDDLAESFMMSIINNGTLRTMKANFCNEEGDVRVIRPFVYVREHQLKEFAYDARLPIINENCPACFEQPKERHRVKKMLAREETNSPHMYDSFRRAMLPLMDQDVYPHLRSVFTQLCIRKDNYQAQRASFKNQPPSTQ